jgi:hypothetical protein
VTGPAEGVALDAKKKAGSATTEILALVPEVGLKPLARQSYRGPGKREKPDLGQAFPHAASPDSSRDSTCILPHERGKSRAELDTKPQEKSAMSDRKRPAVAVRKAVMSDQENWILPLDAYWEKLGKLPIGSEKWRPVRELNPCFRRERPAS